MAHVSTYLDDNTYCQRHVKQELVANRRKKALFTIKVSISTVKISDHNGVVRIFMCLPCLNLDYLNESFFSYLESNRSWKKINKLMLGNKTTCPKIAQTPLLVRFTCLYKLTGYRSQYITFNSCTKILQC